jgi:uncharacterized protein
MNHKQFESIENYAREKMDELGIHGWPHVKRVYNLCMCISKLEKKEAVDLDILKSAALLHDIAKHIEKNDNTIDHGNVGAELAEKFLNSCGFSKDKINSICHAISAHTKMEKPLSIEAEILHDADFIDKLGAVGIATVFIKACLTNKTVEEVAKMFSKEELMPSYVAKHIMWLKEKPRLHTKTGRKIAKKRSKLAYSFFRELVNEIELKDVSQDLHV